MIGSNVVVVVPDGYIRPNDVAAQEEHVAGNWSQATGIPREDVKATRIGEDHFSVSYRVPAPLIWVTVSFVKEDE